MFGLGDKVTIVTGDFRGIGRAVALGLVRHGCQIAVVYASSSVTAEETCARTRKMSTQTEACRRDVSDPTQCRAAVCRIMNDFDRTDVLVNNAGIVRDVITTSIKDRDLTAVSDTNLKDTVHTVRECYLGFVRRHSGSIISVSSVVALLGEMRRITYIAAKARLIGLTKSLAWEVTAREARCNAIAPGIIETKMTKFVQGGRSRLALMPMCRFGKPTKVANLVVLLAGDTNSYITSEVIRVDEGLAT